MSKKRSSDNKKDSLILSPDISRRDFVNGSLVGVGATLLGAAGPGCTADPTPPSAASDPWTGYGGVGDYAISNGNVAAVRDAAHLIRDGKTADLSRDAIDTGETYDMVIIGGGFSGIGAAYQFDKSCDESKRCLVLENHPIYGGEAKQNEFDVDGYRLYGPQGSNDFAPPDRDSDSLIADIYRDTGLPFEYEFVAQGSGNSEVRAPREHFYGIYWEEERYDTGYFVGDDADTPWVVNPRKDKLARMPWSDEFKAELNRAFADVEEYYTGDDIDSWLDSMSYKQLLEDVMGFSSDVTDYFDPILAISMGGVGADAYSAYSAKLLEMPGTNTHYQFENDPESSYSFPGGNTAIMRHIVKYLIDDSIEDGNSFEEILANPIRFDTLDRPDNRVRIRLNATAVDVSHAGAAEDSDHVNVTYYENGQVKKVKAKSVVVSIGGWVARNIVSDMPEPIVDAYKQFYHSPILVVNVALRNWRFLDKLGIAAGRWFEGFGNFFAIRRPMVVGSQTQPFDPDKPTVMTFYVPFNNPDYPPELQGLVGRAELLSKSYADYESEIVSQMTRMFAASGFDAEKDIAGIVLNRWGHAYISPQPGFHFGRDGNPAPKDVVKQGFGRVRFGHSELTGYMSNTRAMEDGARAARDAIKELSATNTAGS